MADFVNLVKCRHDPWRCRNVICRRLRIPTRASGKGSCEIGRHLVETRWTRHFESRHVDIRRTHDFCDGPASLWNSLDSRLSAKTLAFQATKEIQKTRKAMPGHRTPKHRPKHRSPTNDSRQRVAAQFKSAHATQTLLVDPSVAVAPSG